MCNHPSRAIRDVCLVVVWTMHTQDGEEPILSGLRETKAIRFLLRSSGRRGLSPGASKPSTNGRFKTDQSSAESVSRRGNFRGQL